MWWLLGGAGGGSLRGLVETENKQETLESRTKRICGRIRPALRQSGTSSPGRRSTNRKLDAATRTFSCTESTHGLKKLLFRLLFSPLVWKLKIILQNHVPVSRSTLLCDSQLSYLTYLVLSLALSTQIRKCRNKHLG